MTDEATEQSSKRPDAGTKQDRKSRPYFSTQTLGGRQFWGDRRFYRGWRIQQNVITGHHRLLDPADRRHCSGTTSECDDQLDRISALQNLPPMSGRAVVMIHGIGRSSKSFAAMGKALANDECIAVPFDYPSTRVTIPESAAFLASVFQSLEGVETIDVVCHSMGGLLLRAFLMAHQEPRLRRCVMLGVPNKGAEMADFLKNNVLFRAILGPAGQQLISDDNGLIGRLPSPQFEFGVLAGGRSAARGYNPLLSGDNDSTVTVASTRLPGAADFILLPVIHSFLMTDKSCITATQSFLSCGRFDPDREPHPIAADDVTVAD